MIPFAPCLHLVSTARAQARALLRQPRLDPTAIVMLEAITRASTLDWVHVGYVAHAVMVCGLTQDAGGVWR